MNKNEILNAFNSYVKNYGTDDVNITLKISHTLRVAEISQRIAMTLDPVLKIDSEFSWLLGIFHDIGRFEQIRRYGTFYDVFSVDHAELGADILFHEGLIKTFPPISERYLEISENAVRLHNKLKLPENIDKETEIYSNILRDADKADIFRVITEVPYNERTIEESESLTVRPEIMKCVKEHRCIPRAAVKITTLERLTAQCCMAFEIVYPETKKIVNEQGYLNKLLTGELIKTENDEIKNAVIKVMNEVKEELMKAWKEY